MLQVLYRDVLYAVRRFPEPANSVDFFSPKTFTFPRICSPGVRNLKYLYEEKPAHSGKNFGPFGVSFFFFSSHESDVTEKIFEAFSGEMNELANFVCRLS